MEVHLLKEPEIRSLISPAEALEAARDAFASLGRGEVVLPEVMLLDIKDHDGEVHGKGAFIAEGATRLSDREREKALRRLARQLAVESAQMGASESMVVRLVREAMEEIDGVRAEAKQRKGTEN